MNIIEEILNKIIMFKKLKQVCLLIVCFISGISNSQIDTNKIFTEINSLTNDSLVDDFWRRLDSCDQDMNTLRNPILQTENLIKAIYFFKKFGFSDNNRYATEKLSYSDAEIHALIIWMHSCNVDLNYYTFPLVLECVKIYTYFDYPNHFLQNFILFSNKSSPESNRILKKVESNSFDDIEIEKIVEIANEYYILKHEKIDSNNVVGNWKVGRFIAKIYKANNETYYLEYLGSTVKLNKITCSKFNYLDKNNTFFIEIAENGNLIYIDDTSIENFSKIDH